MRQIMIVTAALVTAVVGAVYLGSGEVATLTTVGEDGSRVETPLWVVEIDQTYYLRSGSPDAGWLARLERYPQVELEVGGVKRGYRARRLGSEQERAVVNRAMAEKYGVADAVVGLLFDHSDAIPVRLKPAG